MWVVHIHKHCIMKQLNVNMCRIIPFFQAQDIDKTSENRKMSYSLNGSSFTINQSNGYLSASKHLMMEHTNKGKITLSIVVSNPGCKPAETATQTVVINVQVCLL